MQPDDQTPAGNLTAPLRPWRSAASLRSLVVTAILAAFATHAPAAEVRAAMTITANVVESAGIGSSYQAQELVISTRDIERGYVEVAHASRFQIRNKGPAVLEFRGMNALFRSVRVTSPGGTAEFGAAGGTLLQRPLHGGAGTVALNYRFELVPGVTPGPHQWPLSLTVLPM
jgi:hypothetical protein